MGGVYIRLVVV